MSHANTRHLTDEVHYLRSVVNALRARTESLVGVIKLAYEEGVYTSVISDKDLLEAYERSTARVHTNAAFKSVRRGRGRTA